MIRAIFSSRPKSSVVIMKALGRFVIIVVLVCTGIVFSLFGLVAFFNFVGYRGRRSVEVY